MPTHWFDELLRTRMAPMSHLFFRLQTLENWAVFIATRMFHDFPMQEPQESGAHCLNGTCWQTLRVPVSPITERSDLDPADGNS